MPRKRQRQLKSGSTISYPKKDPKAGREWCLVPIRKNRLLPENFSFETLNKTNYKNMKAKSSKQSKKDKPAVKIKDLKPTKDAKGGAVYQPHGLRDPSTA